MVLSLKQMAVPADSPAGFAVEMEDNSMSPLFPRGSKALIQRGAPLRDGDVGLFFLNGQAVVRQYCEDYAGNVYLFVLNRRHSRKDIYLPREQTPVCCFGRAVLDEPPPLPGYGNYE